jgi:uncharacterized protein DUF6438
MAKPAPIAARHAATRKARYLRIVRIPLLIFIACMVGGCSLFREPPDGDFLESREVALAAAGESYVVLSGGACLGPCPVYEIFVFESGRVVFNGKEHTVRAGLVERITMPSQYFELKKLLAVRRAYSRRFHVGCRTDHAGFEVGAVEGERVRVGHLNYGCFNQVDDLDAITAAFIRVADADTLIR